MSFDWVGLEARANYQQCLLWSAAGSIHNIAMFFIFYTHVALPSKIFQGTSLGHFQGSGFSIKLRSSIRDTLQQIYFDLTRLLHKSNIFSDWSRQAGDELANTPGPSQPVSRCAQSNLYHLCRIALWKIRVLDVSGFRCQKIDTKARWQPLHPNRTGAWASALLFIFWKHNIIINANSVHTTTLENCIILLDNGSRENVTLFWK